jgi:hypothetical protein
VFSSLQSVFGVFGNLFFEIKLWHHKKGQHNKNSICPIRLPLLVLVRTAFGMILRGLGNEKATLRRVAIILIELILRRNGLCVLYMAGT